MMEQPSWEGVVREGVVCSWSVRVETDTGVVDTEGHSPLVGLALRELQHGGGRAALLTSGLLPSFGPLWF